MKIHERILILPIELQVKISEYNPEHRKSIQQLNQEYFDWIYHPCRICKKPFDKEFCTIDYFIIRKYHLLCHWCSLDCFQKDDDHEVKLKCLTAVDDYYKTKG